MRYGQRETYKNRYGVKITVTKTRSGTVVLRAHCKNVRNCWWTFALWDEVLLTGNADTGITFTTYTAWVSAALDRAHGITPNHVL